MRSTLPLASLFLLVPFTTLAQERVAPGQGGRINQLKVLSDKVDDVTTVENIVKSFVKPGMSDQKRRASGLLSR